MGRIDRYIFRTSFGAFALILISLTAVIWITQALRDIDLITGQGQTVLVFVGLTGLIVPLLMLVIAPIALLIAIAYTLNKLNTDSEIVVLNAAGMAPWRLFRPFFAVAVLVAMLVAALAAYISPWGLRELRDWATKVRTDVVANIVQPGRFITIEPGLTFHLRERRPNGQLVGIFMDDRRDHEHQEGNDHAGQADEDQNRLALARDQVDIAQRLRDPDDGGQADENQRERPKTGAKNIAVDPSHYAWASPSPVRPSPHPPVRLKS